MILSPSYPRPVEGDFKYISETAIDVIGLLSRSHDSKAGAVVLFSGEVRDYNAGKEVSYLTYEAHVTIASKMIRDIIEEAAGKWNLNTVVAQHRIGKVAIGETAVVVITASPHRKEAYAANQFIIDKIKHEVPIWKCEVFMDGTKQWGNNCNCHLVTGSNDKHIYD